MAVTVFVDDAVLGRFPPICVKEGITTGDRITQHVEIGRRGLSLARLLLLAGPLGVVALTVVAVNHRPEVLTVQLPMSELAYLRIQAARRANTRAVAWVALAAGGGFLSMVTPWSATPGLGWLLACGLVAGVVGKAVARRELGAASVHLELDASRRWVTISGAHGAFVDAIRSHQVHPAIR